MEGNAEFILPSNDLKLDVISLKINGDILNSLSSSTNITFKTDGDRIILKVGDSDYEFKKERIDNSKPSYIYQQEDNTLNKIGMINQKYASIGYKPSEEYIQKQKELNEIIETNKKKRGINKDSKKEPYILNALNSIGNNINNNHSIKKDIKPKKIGMNPPPSNVPKTYLKPNVPTKTKNEPKGEIPIKNINNVTAKVKEVEPVKDMFDEDDFLGLGEPKKKESPPKPNPIVNKNKIQIKANVGNTNTNVNVNNVNNNVNNNTSINNTYNNGHSHQSKNKYLNNITHTTTTPPSQISINNSNNTTPTKPESNHKHVSNGVNSNNHVNNNNSNIKTNNNSNNNAVCDLTSMFEDSSQSSLPLSQDSVATSGYSYTNGYSQSYSGINTNTNTGTLNPTNVSLPKEKISPPKMNTIQISDNTLQISEEKDSLHNKTVGGSSDNKNKYNGNSSKDKNNNSNSKSKTNVKETNVKESNVRESNENKENKEKELPKLKIKIKPPSSTSSTSISSSNHLPPSSSHKKSENGNVSSLSKNSAKGGVYDTVDPSPVSTSFDTKKTSDRVTEKKSTSPEDLSFNKLDVQQKLDEFNRLLDDGCKLHRELSENSEFFNRLKRKYSSSQNPNEKQEIYTQIKDEHDSRRARIQYSLRRYKENSVQLDKLRSSILQVSFKYPSHFEKN